MTKTKQTTASAFLSRLAEALGCAGDMQSIAVAVGEVRGKSERLGTLLAVAQTHLAAAKDSVPTDEDIRDLARGVEDNPADVLACLQRVHRALAALSQALENAQ